MTLKQSFLWSAIQQVGPRVVQILIGLVLAHLLDPRAFGLVGMLALFVGLAQVFSDCGLSASLIQRKTLSADDETSVFAMNVVAGFGLAALQCLVSPFVAWFYGQPVLMPMLCVHSLSIVLSSLCIVQIALLERTMQFKKTALVSAASTVSSGLVGLGLAYFGCGVWSLVISGVAAVLVRAAILWSISSWRPNGKVRLACVRSMWSFSSYLLYCNLIGIIYQNMYAVVIGKVYSPASLGYYDRANNLRMLPAGIMTGIVDRVAFPLFSRCQDDKALLLQKIREILRGTLFLSAGALTLLAVIADPLVPLLMSEKWRPSIPLLRILCYAGVFYPISSLYLMALQAQGHSDLNFRLESIKMVNVIVAVALVYSHGVQALAWSVVGLTVIAYFLNAYYNVKLLGYRWSMQAQDILPTFCVCAVSGWTAWWIGSLVPASTIIVLLASSASFMLLCITAVFCFRKMFFDGVWGHLAWGVNWLRQKLTPGLSASA